MLSAAQRQAKLAGKVKARVIVDKREELYGKGDIEEGYTDEQVDHVDAIVNAYTPEEFAANVATIKKQPRRGRAASRLTATCTASTSRRVDRLT